MQRLWKIKKGLNFNMASILCPSLLDRLTRAVTLCFPAASSTSTESISADSARSLSIRSILTLLLMSAQRVALTRKRIV